MASIRTASNSTEHLGRKNTSYELDNYGIKEPARVYWNLNTPELYEEIARRNEGAYSNHGAIIVDTGEHTGRAAKDKAIVREPGSEDKVFWGDVNKDFSQLWSWIREFVPLPEDLPYGEPLEVSSPSSVVVPVPA